MQFADAHARSTSPPEFATRRSRNRTTSAEENTNEEETENKEETFKCNIEMLDKYKSETLFAPKITDRFDKSVLTNNPRIFHKSDDVKYHGRVHEYVNKIDWDIKYIDKIDELLFNTVVMLLSSCSHPYTFFSICF